MVSLGRKVKILYTSRLEDGTIIDSSDLHNGAPLEFVVGARQVISGLDKAVSNMEAFEKRTVTIPAAEAFGEHDETLREVIPVTDFPHAENLPVGEFIALSLPEGQTRTKVEKIENGMIHFDFNHEYAGQNIIFDIELTEILGETGSAIENEKHAGDCVCGCHKLKEQLTT